MARDVLDCIKEAKEIMGDKAAEIIAKGFKLDNWDGVGKASSPYTSDSNPSCIWNKKEKYFKDFSTGRVIGILDYYMYHYKESYKGAIIRLCNETGVQLPDSDFGYSKGQLSNDYVYPHEESNTDRSIVENYCSARGISTETLDLAGVKQDSHGNVTFELRNLDNELLCVKYRLSRPAHKNESKMWWQPKASTCPLLYNINHVRFDEPLLITEGYFDCLSAIEAGYTNVVSIPGGAEDTNWIEFNYDFLKNFQEYIIWYDNDNAGIDGRNKVIKRLGEYKCKIVEVSEAIADAVEYYYQTEHGVKNIRKTDANNVLLACGADAILQIIHEAKEIENPLVKRLMDYEEQQLQDMPKITTGFKALDRVMYGNFDNSLTVLTGKPGEGKSTLLNQFFVAEPMEAGERVFIYSGELPARILLGNILRPLASQRHIMQFDNGENQPKGYVVTRQASAKIKEFYRDNLFVFDDLDDLDTNGGSLLDTMEYCYKKYNITSYVIDNLMTVDMKGIAGDNKLECQIQFVKRLKKFTRMYPVKVLLVAHARKLSPGANAIGIDDISGASEITKICDRCYNISAIKDDGEGKDSLITVIKDRQTGHVGAKFELYYDPYSNRIYTDEQELQKKYRWERETPKINYADHELKNIVANIPELTRHYDVVSSEDNPF